MYLNTNLGRLQKKKKIVTRLHHDYLKVLGLPKITKGHTAIVGCCTSNLTHVTSDNVSTLRGIGETM